MWKRLSDPNTLPFIGAYIRGSELVMVSEWMENGNIKQYLVKNPHVNRHSLVSHRHPGLARCCRLLTLTAGGRCTRRCIFA